MWDGLFSRQDRLESRSHKWNEVRFDSLLDAIDERTAAARPFGFDGVTQCLVSCGEDNEVSALFAALVRHAADEVLDDDATVVIARQTGATR